MQHSQRLLSTANHNSQSFKQPGKVAPWLSDPATLPDSKPFIAVSSEKIVKSILKHLSPCDSPVLNLQLLFKIWLTYVLDPSLNSMRALFYRLNQPGIQVDMSTFSKANKTRRTE